MKPLSEYEVIDYQDNEVKHFHYEDEEKHYYTDIESFLLHYVLGFCSCGRPESVLELIYNLVMLKEYWSNNDDVDYKKYDELRTEYLINNIDKVKWFFDYFLDKKEITTHGGNVSGSWIDDQNFLDAINIWYKEYRKD